MEEQLLKEIIVELKGMRAETVETKKEIQGLRKDVDLVKQESVITNKRLDSLMQESMTTNKRLDSLMQEGMTTNKRLDGLHQSFVVLQQGFADMRFSLQSIKEYLVTRVVWNNDSIEIETKEGNSIHGIIHSSHRDIK